MLEIKSNINLDEIKRVMFVLQPNEQATLFAVDSFNLSDCGRNTIKLFDGESRDGKWFAIGLGTMGAMVRTAYCPHSGDVSKLQWNEDFESDKYNKWFVNLTLNGVYEY